MTRSYSRLIWGSLLVLAGGLLLLQNLNVFPFRDFVWAILWSIAFAAAGVVFIGVYWRNRAQWWAIIPGLVLLGLGLVIALSLLFPGDAGAWIGGVFLAMIGAAFWIVYLTNREYWWAIIPGGTLVTLGVVAGATALWSGIELGGVFFAGLGVTFLLVAVAPGQNGQLRWAYIPATVMLVMAVFIMLAATPLINYIWPLALLAAGCFLLYRSFIYRRG